MVSKLDAQVPYPRPSSEEERLFYSIISILSCPIYLGTKTLSLSICHLRVVIIGMLLYYRRGTKRSFDLCYLYEYNNFLASLWVQRCFCLPFTLCYLYLGFTTFMSTLKRCRWSSTCASKLLFTKVNWIENFHRKRFSTSLRSSHSADPSTAMARHSTRLPLTF